jgi:hypothetical protein
VTPTERGQRRRTMAMQAAGQWPQLRGELLNGTATSTPTSTSTSRRSSVVKVVVAGPGLLVLRVVGAAAVAASGTVAVGVLLAPLLLLVLAVGVACSSSRGGVAPLAEEGEEEEGEGSLRGAHQAGLTHPLLLLLPLLLLPLPRPSTLLGQVQCRRGTNGAVRTRGRREVVGVGAVGQGGAGEERRWGVANRRAAWTVGQCWNCFKAENNKSLSD